MTRIDCACLRARHQHGTLAAYRRDRCRCLQCRLAHNAARKAYATIGAWSDGLLVPAAGTVRRIQALNTLGYSCAEIGRHMGVSRQAVTQLRDDNRAKYRVTADRVSVVYESLCCRKPVGAAALRAALHAKRMGWVPPLAWLDIDDPDERPERRSDREIKATVADPITVERMMLGDPPAYISRADRVAAVTELAGRGWSPHDIAMRLGMNYLTVVGIVNETAAA